ncbi:uncharacterized protein [Asterias amurensis]|uniref:uncharacterized protein n=1 Tax=Asterias amurensis TaxID=7602 RepID=UPI003AB61A22
MSSSFQAEAIAAHNQARTNHGVPPLKLNKELCKHAQKWADHLASIGKLEHSSNQEFGENVAMVSGYKDYSGQQVTDQWYSEVQKYNFSSPGFRSGTGHFSQVVWKDSKEMGIGKAETKDGKIFVVANYKPPGNMMSMYNENVFPVHVGGVSKVVTHGEFSAAGPGERMRGGGDENEPLSKFQQDALSVHNEHRSKHGVDSLRMSADLCKSAQDWAEHLAKNDLFEHSKGTDIGENVAMHYSSATTAYSGKQAADQWYSELSKYDFNKPGFTSGTGHFTQMVWKGSREFGIGKAVTKGGKVMVVGQYRPPGNIVGRFEEHVLPRPDGYRPQPTEAITSKVTRVVRSTEYVGQDPARPRSDDRRMDSVTRQVAGVKLDAPDLSPSDLAKFQKDALDSHNKYRSRYGAADLKRSDELMKRAQDWAAHLAKNDQFKNSGQSDVGENIAMHYSSASTAFSGEDTSEMWYRQSSKYDFEKPGFTSGAGHFTQMVWKDTKEMGIGKAITKEGKVVLVAFYRPPGNVMGKFEGQVSKEK